MQSFPHLRNSVSSEKEANMFPKSLQCLKGREGDRQSLQWKLGVAYTLLTRPCTHQHEGRKEGRNQPHWLCLFLPLSLGKRYKIVGTLSRIGRRISICQHDRFSFSTSPQRRSPDKLRFGASVLFNCGPCSRRNLSSLVKRKESFIPILTSAEQGAESPRWPEEHG